MRILMFGWEFPPFSSGGLATACYGLAKSLSKNNEIVFVMPYYHKKIKHIFVKVIGLLSEDRDDKDTYGGDLIKEVKDFAAKAGEIAKKENFDVIHCHDWMTFNAGIEAKKSSGKPLVIHVHSTEFDRTPGQPCQFQFEVEKRGMQEADRIITVSKFEKYKIVSHYEISPDKVSVVYNSINPSSMVKKKIYENPEISTNDKIVLFLGRLTYQKGPEYFLKAAKRVLEKMNNVRFVIVGKGNLAEGMENLAEEMGIKPYVTFTGYCTPERVKDYYKKAHLYVMPSVSEPFGIAPLEALNYGAPVLISKQSGVSEILNNSLKSDFWDVDKIATEIIAVLKYPELYECLRENGMNELKKFSWTKAAAKTEEVYGSVVPA